MREIKFRAWDKHSNEIIDWHELKICHSDCWWHPEVYELMQYTGLNDKNGKEIYEGDIVELEHYDNYAHRWLPYTKSAIEWSIEDGCCLMGAESLYAFTARHSEVIGNIYENKELLNDNQSI